MSALIHYGLHPGMLIRYLKGEYFGESQDVKKVLTEVKPYVEKKDLKHIKRILTQGCPSQLIFEEESANKLAVIQKGNQQTFLQHPEVVTKTTNKEEKNSHVLPLLLWTVYFSPYLCCSPQGMREKDGKHQVIFDTSTQTMPDEVVLNHVMMTDEVADIHFGQAKQRLYSNIYNRGVSYPDEIMYIILANIRACF